MNYKEIKISNEKALDLSEFIEMDYYAVEHYELPIELMMENAGLQLANLISGQIKDVNDKILIGVANGNNSGGGLVAARRLAAWGYNIYLDIITDITKELPKKQLDRAVKFGAITETISLPEIWVDAYLGFSQRLPLSSNLLNAVNNANNCKCKRISLDIPTGFLGNVAFPYFQADQVLSLAAAKKILYHLPAKTEIFIADLGIPKKVYQKFDVDIPPFQNKNILKIII